MDKQLFRETIFATLFIMLLVFLINLLPLKFEFVKPIKQGFNDFDIYDLLYTGKGNENNGLKDTNIIIVQVADTRTKIALQINDIKALQPAVLGIDISFANKKELISDNVLMSEITSNDSVVAGYTIDPESSTSLIKENFIPHDFLIKNGGYINFAQTDSFSIIRQMRPSFTQHDTTYFSFATQIVKKYAPDKFAILKQKNNRPEIINYQGNIDHYLNYSMAEFDSLFASNQLSNIKGKIVLLGFFSKNDGGPKRMEDIRFTPLNEETSGKSFPDMYGVAIHANTISMILNAHDYITEVPLWISFIIAYLFSFCIIYYILYCFKKNRHPLHIVYLFWLLILILLIVYFFLKLYDWFNLKVNILPIILAMVLSEELFDVYEKFAKFLNKKMHYKTLFSSAKH